MRRREAVSQHTTAPPAGVRTGSSQPNPSFHTWLYGGEEGKPRPCLRPEPVRRSHLCQSRQGRAARRGCSVPPSVFGLVFGAVLGRLHPCASQAFPKGPPLYWKDISGGASPQRVTLIPAYCSSEAASAPAFVPLPSPGSLTRNTYTISCWAVGHLFPPCW